MPMYDVSIPPQDLEDGNRGYDPYENAQPGGGFRRLIAIGLVAAAGLGIYQHTSTNESHDLSPEAPHEEQFIAPEVASPEIAAINIALSEVKLGQTNNLDNLVAAIINADAAFAPTDTDRMPNMPAGYVKFLLPHEARGIAVPYTIAERTADKERYTSPQLAAAMYASAKLFQDLIATKYPHLFGEMLRMRDFNGPSHDTHNTGTQVDFSSALGWGVTQYATGSFADKQFSERYSQEFTIDMFTEIAGLQAEGTRIINSVLFTDPVVRDEVNGRVGDDFIRNQKWHADHGHATARIGHLPQWRPTIADLPWSDRQDLKIGGEAEAITDEQRSSQHQDFELWILSRQQYTDQLNAQDNLTAPEGFESEPLTEAAEAHIDALDITDERKDFLRQMVPSIATVYRKGAKINPIVVLAQTSLETGFGADLLSEEANNYFGMKAGNKWKGDIFDAETKEEYQAGEVETIVDGFRMYPNTASSVADHARLIQTAPHYADAVANYQSIEGYTYGLFNEVDGQGNIIKEQGEPGVLSYGTDRGYEQKIFDVIDQYGYETLMLAQLGAERIVAIDGIMER